MLTGSVIILEWMNVVRFEWGVWDVELQYNVEREGLVAVPTTDYHAIVEANAAKMVPRVCLTLPLEMIFSVY
jgi:hypothetical protein